MIERELFRRFPELRSTVPWVPLANLPTPVTSVAIPAPDGRLVDVAIKRDDLSGDIYGGNKLRKLEFLLAAAKASGARRLITAGAFGSHHALATTVHGRRMGFDVTVILFPQHVTPHVRDIVLMIAGLGAEIRFTRRMEFVPVALARVRRSYGRDAYVIPPGGSDAIGTLGYVECGLEMAQQISSGDVGATPERIHVAAGTLGTAAGLALGLTIAGIKTEIAGVRITSPLVTNERALNKLLRGALTILARSGASLPDVSDVARHVRITHDQVGDGYGKPTAASERATSAMEAAGIRVDATYTAKAAAALMEDPLTWKGRTLLLHTLSAVEPVESSVSMEEARLPHPIASRLRASA